MTRRPAEFIPHRMTADLPRFLPGPPSFRHPASPLRSSLTWTLEAFMAHSFGRPTAGEQLFTGRVSQFPADGPCQTPNQAIQTFSQKTQAQISPAFAFGLQSPSAMPKGVRPDYPTKGRSLKPFRTRPCHERGKKCCPAPTDVSTPQHSKSSRGPRERAIGFN